MKKEYVRPTMVGEKFVANEYVAACGDSGVSSYNFKCDAPGGKLYYYSQFDGKIDGVYEGSEKAILLGDYTPCSKTHKAPTTDDYYDGFVDYNKNGRYDSGEGVIVWRGKWGLNGHATANLDMTTWETDKS